MIRKIKTYLFGEFQDSEVSHIDLPDNIEYSQDFINWFKQINRL
jgi:hypothetical protein